MRLHCRRCADSNMTVPSNNHYVHCLLQKILDVVEEHQQKNTKKGKNKAVRKRKGAEEEESEVEQNEVRHLLCP